MQLSRAVGVLVLAMTMIAGCSSAVDGTPHSGPGSSHHGSAPASVGHLRVRVAITGGPANPRTGRSALQNHPMPGVKVTAVAAGGAASHALTAKNGEAVLDLAAGTYTVTSSRCANAPRRVAVHADRVAFVRFDCEVP